MADTTGAPWNLPYPEDSDLVRDGASDIEALAVATAAGLTDASLIKQVVQTVKNDAFVTTSGTFVDVTGLTVTITPATATNKVLLIASVALGHGRAGDQTFALLTDSADVPVIAVASGQQFDADVAPTTLEMIRQGWVSLITPGVTTAVTYKIRIRSSATFFDATVNQRGAGGAFSYSTLTAIEVAA